MLIYLIAAILIYLINNIVCLLYCSLKKKQNSTSYHNRVDDDNIDYKKDNSFSLSILHFIKQMLNAWMIFRVKVLGKIPSQRYRRFILKLVFKMDMEKNVIFYGWDTIRHPWNIHIGVGTIIGNDAYLDGRNGLFIGNNVNLSGRVSIHTEQHDVNDPWFRSLSSGGSVTIGDRAWISSNTIILPGISVGKGAVLAAGAVATKDLEEYGVYAGIPAKKIAERKKNLQYEFDGDFLPFI